MTTHERVEEEHFLANGPNGETFTISKYRVIIKSITNNAPIQRDKGTFDYGVDAKGKQLFSVGDSNEEFEILPDNIVVKRRQ